MTPYEVYKNHEYVIEVGISHFFGSIPNAKAIAHKMGMDFDDIHQYAALAVWEVALKHDAENHKNFFSFAKTAIWMKLREICVRKPSLLKLPQKNAIKLRESVEIRRFDKVIKDDGPEDFTLHDVLPSSHNTENFVIRKMQFEERMSKANENERKVLYMLLNGMNETEVGERLGITRKGVSARRLRALKKIRAS